MRNHFCKIPMTIIALLLVPAFAMAQYQIQYQLADTAAQLNKSRFKTSFPSQRTAIEYINTLPQQMAALGYLSASIDSIRYATDTAYLKFYLGHIFTFYSIQPDSQTQKVLTQTGITWKKKPSPIDLQKNNERLLDYYENTGYPFATILLDSMHWQDNDLHASMKIHTGAVYKIDSIHVQGKAKISQSYLQRYLHIPNGSVYNRDMLDQIDQRISELPFVQQGQPWKLQMLTGGATVNLFLDPKRSSQVYALVGLAPASDQLGGTKLLLTGEANISLKNALGAGETIGVNWQQLQYKSPRIILQFQYPYIFKSSFGIDAGFELFKKDSQWVNVNARAGILYELSARQTGKLSIQTAQTNVGFTDTNAVRTAKQLPAILDISSTSFAVDYAFNSTNYRFNPRNGWDISFQVAAGTKKVKRNNDILKLKDPNDPTFKYSSLYDSLKGNAYLLRIKNSLAYYIPVGRQSVFKAALQSGWYQSPDIFRNEMFQIGGYKLLRGFDEESIYGNIYSVLTAEYRFLLGTNSYFFGFADGGYVGYKQRTIKYSNSYLGTGLGLAFETRNSLLNLSFAIGKRDDLPLNFKQMKIHIGFVNFF